MADNDLGTEQHEHNSDDDGSSSSDSSDSEFDGLELNPTQEFEEPFLCASLKAIRDLYTSYDDEQAGKWMMFFHKKILDDKWKLCCDLYQAGKLVGIKEMSVSTNYENPKAQDHTIGVIKFYCGPINDESTIMEYGRILLENVPYYNMPLYYKSNLQSGGGTRATGQIINHLYKIDQYKSGFILTKDDEIELNPTQEFEKPFLNASLKAIRDLYTSYDDEQAGKWMMFFHKKILDDKWKLCCDLYKAGKLVGIKEMSVSTNYGNPIACGRVGVIKFFCGPINDESSIMEYGRILLENVPYHLPTMYYKSNLQSEGGTRATGQIINHLYRIDQYKSGFILTKDVVELSPTKEYEKPHLQASLKAIRDLYTSYADDQTGKWILPFREDALDEKWKLCCDLYKAGKLYGIRELRVPTNYNKPDDKGNVVIEFFCGPANDENLVIEYGRKLVEVVSYHGKFPIYYKKCQQSRSGGTGGTRGTPSKQLNYLYKIYQHESVHRSFKKNYPESDTRIDNWRSRP